jgi:XTP/dITP diphosphohydrolase
VSDPISETIVVVATRSHHKLREIRQLVPPIPGLRFIDLDEAGVPVTPGEDTIEAFETFEENALAKARWFHQITGLPVLSDDSGLCVDALNGAPGVFSKRFSGRNDLSGQALDNANNQHLLESLAGTPEPRTARYVCMIALVTADGTESLHRGSCEGEIVREAAGSGGFGYDPLFLIPQLGATLGQLPAEVKNSLSHRKHAVDRAAPMLREIGQAADPHMR